MSLINTNKVEDYCGSPGTEYIPPPEDLLRKILLPDPITVSVNPVLGPPPSPDTPCWSTEGELAMQYHEKAIKAMEKPESATARVPSTKFLEDAVTVQKQRAALRDTPSGERSMAKIVAVFNALTDHSLSVAEGWEFMVLLKLVRGRQGFFDEDSYTDAVSYISLLGEEESTLIARR